MFSLKFQTNLFLTKTICFHWNFKQTYFWLKLYVIIENSVLYSINSTVQDDNFPRGVHENNITDPIGQINRDVMLNKLKQSGPRLHYTNINYYNIIIY